MLLLDDSFGVPGGTYVGGAGMGGVECSGGTAVASGKCQLNSAFAVGGISVWNAPAKGFP